MEEAGKTVNYASESSWCTDDVGRHGPLGCNPGYRLFGSDAPDDQGGARLLPEDGAGVRIVNDAFQPFLLSGTKTRYSRQSGINIFSDPAI